MTPAIFVLYTLFVQIVKTYGLHIEVEASRYDAIIDVIDGGCKDATALTTLLTTDPAITANDTISNVKDLANRLTLQGHGGRVYSVSFNHNGSMLATGSLDGTAKLWSIPDGQLMKTLTRLSTVTSVSFNHDGSMLATGSHDVTAKIWSIPDGQLMKTLTGHGGRVRSVSFNHDGSMLATGSYDGTAKVWSIPDGQIMKTLTKSVLDYAREKAYSYCFTTTITDTTTTTAVISVATTTISTRSVIPISVTSIATVTDADAPLGLGLFISMLCALVPTL